MFYDEEEALTVINKMRFEESPFNGLLVRFSGEITIKSERTRAIWERLLFKYVKMIVGGYGGVRRERGRIYIFLEEKDSEAFSRIILRLSKLFGISSISPAIICKSSLKEIINCADMLVKYYLDNVLKDSNNKSFAIIAKKSLARSFGTTELRYDVGAYVKEKYNLRVDLENPDIPIYIEAREDLSFIYSDIISGPGGLPYKVQDKVVSLMSGGPDSTLATWFVLRRGSPIVGVYYDFGAKDLRREARKRILEIFRHICENWIPFDKCRLYILQFDDVVREIFKSINDNRIAYVLLKRLMLFYASIIAEKEEAKGIVTGEIIGEHASQTVWNLDVISYGSKIQILRPILGFDKADVLRILKKIDKKLYELASKSVEPCRLVTGIKPTTKADFQKVMQAEKTILDNLRAKKLIDEIISNGTIIEF